MKRLTALLACLFAVCAIAHAQHQRNIPGRVLDENGDPVIGAFVSSESPSGELVGTVTDENGMFNLQGVSDEAKNISISLLGMKSRTCPISSFVDVTLTDDAQALDESIVVAYETVKKSSYSGSVVMLRSDKLENLPVTSFENAIAGKVAGVQISPTTGQVGSISDVRIRGNGSMNAGNEPLYVVDGVPVISGSVGMLNGELFTTNNIMTSLNTEDIESISVLKDAAAASLYGSRAANGVILITTKKGKPGRAKVEFKASVGLSPRWATGNYETASVEENLNMLYMVFYDYAQGHTRTYGGVKYDGNTAEGATGYALAQLNGRFNKHGYSLTTAGPGKFQDVIVGEYGNSGRGAGNYFDWDDAYFRTAVYRNYDLTVSGADDKTNYYASIAYTKEDGRLKINSFDRISGRINFSKKIRPWLEMGTNGSISRTKKSGYNDSRDTTSNTYMQTRNLLWGLYWPTNYLDGSPWTDRYGSWGQNYVYYDTQWENYSVNTKVSAIETITIHPLPNFDIVGRFSYDETIVSDHLYYSAEHPYGTTDNGLVREMRTIYDKMVASTTATYHKMFGKHDFSAMGGFEAEKNRTNYTYAQGANLPNSTLHTLSTAANFTASGYEWGYGLASFLLKLDYNFAKKYYASASFRWDGNSRLSPDVRWGAFKSVGFSWRLSQEDFLKDVEWIDELKVRATFGSSGTTPSTNYGFMSLMTYESPYMGNPGGVITSIGNEELKWEKSHTINLGVDFGFLKNRIRGSVEFFNKNSSDLLQDVPISTATGFKSVLMNVGGINNHGLEVQLDGTIMKRREFSWDASFNATFLSSKITQLYDNADIIWYNKRGSTNMAQFIYREGESTLALYGYEWAGVDKTNGKSVYYVNGEYDPSSSDYFKYNGRVATYDYKLANYTVIGDVIPKISGGFSTTMKWKQFDMTASFIYKVGGSLYDAAERDVDDDGYYWERIRSKYYYDNMWTEQNPNGTQPALSGYDRLDSMQYSSRHVYDATFLRMKHFTLGYTIPSSLVSKVRIASARVYFNGSNLLTLSKYKIADPEVNATGTRGWETPIPMTFTLGVDVKF